MKIEFEKQFGKGTDPWYAKAERWAKKKKFPISFLALGLIAYLKKVWVNVKVENTMRSVDADVEKIHELWDDEEKKQFAPEIIETPSEVEGLNDLMIGPRDDIDFYGY
jgi:hypothetical protein|tara:strand:+ start:734 stop:1057 length:324 start_codon:yes stop_codon:yes gene_type:complete